MVSIVKIDVVSMPPRSQIYRLVPCEVETMWRESLTSYMNRLGWTHRVSPRAMVVQEILPRLDKPQEGSRLWINALSRGYAKNINGTGDLALEWSGILEQLTLRSDLHLLTLRGWIGTLLSSGHLKAYPVWCPLCYSEWREKGLCIYQPLVWLFKMVTACPRHHRLLESHCPHCQKTQSVIALRTAPGHCTQCNRWLGVSADETWPQSLKEGPTHWQQWVLHALGELHAASMTNSLSQWETFFTHLEMGFAPALDLVTWKKIEVFTGVKSKVFKEWFHLKRTPSLETIFKLCYVCAVTPLQIMRGETSSLVETFQRGTTSRSPLRRRVIPKVDQELCLAFIRAVLDGHEEPLGLRQLAERLGCSLRILLYYFPEECALITQRVREHRKQQSEQRTLHIQEKVRQQVLSLHAQGIYPSHKKVRSLLPPGLMRQSAAEEAWRATLRELGFEPRNVRHTHVGPAPISS